MEKSGASNSITTIRSRSLVQENDEVFPSRMSLNDNKAGMHGLDKEKINKIIMENTVGSRYFKNEQKRAAQVQERISKMKARLITVTASEKVAALQKADEIMQDVEKERNLDRTIIHIDMDAFYASVEERDQPHLKTKPMAVGGMDMLSTSNYVARKYGVRAAMPGFIALKLCPELVIVPLNFTKYKEVSQMIQKIYAEYDENFMAASLDEAYLDITDHLASRILLTGEQRTHKYHPELVTSNDNPPKTSRTFGFSAEEVAEEIRFRIHQETKLTASAGIGPNLMLAKIGSDLNKPNGQALIPFEKEAILNFMKDLPLRKVSGIGKVSEELLSSLGVRTCGDLVTKRDIIILLFSSVSSKFFLRAGLGSSSNRCCQDSERKSISTERTFNAISSEVELLAKLEELCIALSEDLRRNEVEGKTVTLKTKTVNFELHTRSKTSVRSLSTCEEIFEVAKELLRQEIEQAGSKLSLRLMGVGLSKLESPSGNKQSSIKRFFTKSETNKAKESLDQIKEENSHEKENDNCLSESSIFDGPSSSTLLKKENEEKTSLTEQEDLVCPVCSKTDFTKLTDLNSHLDQCLRSKVQPSENVDPKPRISDLTCPLCSVVFDGSKTDLQFFNSHVDTCLNRQVIKDMLKRDSMSSDKSSKTALKSPIKSNKRRKLHSKQSNTIEKFFSFS